MPIGIPPGPKGKKKSLPNWATEEYKPPYKEGSGLQPYESKPKTNSKSGVSRPHYDVKKVFKTN